MSELRTRRAGITRRRLLAAGGGTAALALGSSFGMRPAAATVPTSQRFDLTQPSHDLFRAKPLFQQTVMQSFTFDVVNRRLFVAQLRNGGSSDANGDLCITQLDSAGNQLGHMFLTGFGHGVSIGVEPAGSTPFLWTEVDSVNGRGTRLARFPFRNGQTLDHRSTALQKHLPISGVETVTCATDPIYNRLVMRYRKGRDFRFAVYNIVDVRNGVYDRKLADIPQPAGLGTIQGYTAYGQYLYLLDGDAYSSINPPPGNTHVNSVSLNGGPSPGYPPRQAGA